MRYIERFPETKPRDIILQLTNQNPHPWPDVSDRQIRRLLKELKGAAYYSRLYQPLSISADPSIITVNLKPLLLKQNHQRQSGICNLHWRKIQVLRYLHANPSHGPKEIIEQLRSRSPNPWPGATLGRLKKHLQAWQGQHYRPEVSMFTLTTYQKFVGCAGG